MEDSILTQLKDLRVLYRDAAPTDAKTINQYAWIIAKAVNGHAEELGGLMCRQLLADVMQLPIERPSALFSSILWAAVKISGLFPDFHFVRFLNLWDPTRNLRPEDRLEGKSADGKVYLSLEERMTRAVFTSQLLWPEDQLSFSLPNTFGYHGIVPMIVSKVSLSEVDGRKLYFAHLFAADGMEIVAESHLLRRHPLVVSEKRHYVNVGQIYNVVLRDKKEGAGCRVVDGILSQKSAKEQFPVSVGFVDGIDEGHGHIHVFDADSRHYVSFIQKYSKIERGSLVEFVPRIPRDSNFKSAVILPTSKSREQLAVQFPLREIVIKKIDEEKQYCAWELVDKSNPLLEKLSPKLQAEGAISSFATFGYMNLPDAQRMLSGLSVGMKVKAIIYLRRGKDGNKRPYVACAL